MFSFLVVISFVSIVRISADNECAYSAMGMIATPLDSCSVYSMAETTSMSYSSSYAYNEDTNTLTWNYYSDSACSALVKSYEMDDVMMGIHRMSLQTNGAGSNCQTVDIKVSGAYSKLTDDCDASVTTTDYRTMSYVINECVASSTTEQASSMLKCDDKKIYFELYQGCSTCDCDDAPKTFVYEYYEDKDDSCYSVVCNAPQTDNPYGGEWSDAQFLKSLISDSGNTPMLAVNIANAVTVSKQNTNPSLVERMPSIWIYVVVAAGLFVGLWICRCINTCTPKKDDRYFQL